MTGESLMNAIIKCCYYVLMHNPKLKSDYARSCAFTIAECASRGFITSINISGEAQDFWMCTLKGFKLIEEQRNQNNGTIQKDIN